MGIGTKPEGWKLIPLGELADSIPGGTPSTSVNSYWNGEILWATPSDITATSGKYIDSTERTITDLGLKHASQLLPVGSILLCTRATIGEAKIAASPITTNQGFKSLIPKVGVSNEWLYYVTQHLKREMISLSSGSTFLELGTKQLKGILVSTPSNEEQVAIADALSDIDVLIKNLKREILKRKNFRIAITQEKLTNNSGKVIKLGDHSHFYKGFGLAKADLTDSGAYPAIHYGELFLKYPETISETISSTNKFNPNSFLSRTNDVLMPSSDVTPTGLAVASCIKVDGVILGGDVLVIRPDKNIINGSYLSYVIRNSREQILRLVNGTTVFHIYGKDLAKFEFRLPDIDEQNEVVFLLDALRNEFESLEKELYKYECIKQGMMHDLLTGKVRLL